MRTIDRKKKLIILAGVLILVCIIVVTVLYKSQSGVRDWIDMHIFRKNLVEKDARVINLSTDKANQIHVYGKYIAILNDKSISLYNSNGEKIKSIDVDINTAIFDSSNKYLAIAEKGGKEVCLILDKTYLWSTKTDGDILQVHVNKNGYVAVITTDVAHKSILTLYNSEGKKLFNRYFSSTRIIDASISNGNDYIAVGELDTSGATIVSKVKIISVDNAQKDPENTIIYTYDVDAGRLIASVKYQIADQVLCVYDNGASIIRNKENREIIKIENDSITHISGNFRNHLIYIQEQSEGLFKVSSNIHIINTSNNQETVYKLEDISKEVYANENIMAINVGTDVHFINTSGWLIKKYTANQEITNVKVSDGLGIVIYKDKIEIINL